MEEIVNKMGIFMYYNGRLISIQKSDLYSTNQESHGILVIFDVPYGIIMPEPNKEDFNIDKDKKKELLRILDDIVLMFIDTVKRNSYLKPKDAEMTSMENIWRDLGYLRVGETISNIPSNEEGCKRRRHVKIPDVRQCNYCLKWRAVPPLEYPETYFVADNWNCLIIKVELVKSIYKTIQSINLMSFV